MKVISLTQEEQTAQWHVRGLSAQVKRFQLRASSRIQQPVISRLQEWLLPCRRRAQGPAPLLEFALHIGHAPAAAAHILLLRLEAKLAGKQLYHGASRHQGFSPHLPSMKPGLHDVRQPVAQKIALVEIAPAEPGHVRCLVDRYEEGPPIAARVG